MILVLQPFDLELLLVYITSTTSDGIVIRGQNSQDIIDFDLVLV